LEQVPITVIEREPEYFVGEQKGTYIEITDLKSVWTRGKLRDVYRSVMSLQSPFESIQSFKVDFDTNHDEWLDGLLTIEKIKDHALFFADVVIEGDEIVELNLNEEKKLETILNIKNFDYFWNEESQRYIDLINSSDKIIISTGMINFTISPLLKNFLDNILQANKTFKYKYDGKGTSVGLVDSNKKVQLIMAQGSYKDWYKFSAFDDYLKEVLHFIGLKNIELLLFDGTKTNEQKDLSIEEKFKLKEKEFNELVIKF
ncbi:MAG: FMN-dependent NADH-azoreductase, partial [Mycoplasmataceae bacterium]|nr:FMN-dependent NADH-azoreductase [Mycoplasmataceae bacterium]